MSFLHESVKPGEIKFVPRIHSERGRVRVEFGYGALEQDQYRRMLANHVNSNTPPTIYVISFEGECQVITPSKLIGERYSTAESRRRFLDERSYDLYDAREVIVEHRKPTYSS